MDRRLLVSSWLLLCVACVGCGPTVEERLVGKWQGTVELDGPAIEKKGAETQNPLLTILAKQIAENLDFRLELKADKTLASQVRAGALSKEVTGTWKVQASDKTQATVVVSEPDGEQTYKLVLDDDFLQGTGGFSVPAWGDAAGLGTFRFKRAP